jgi:hypothetical protein
MTDQIPYIKSSYKMIEIPLILQRRHLSILLHILIYLHHVERKPTSCVDCHHSTMYIANMSLLLGSLCPDAPGLGILRSLLSYLDLPSRHVRWIVSRDHRLRRATNAALQSI